MVNDERMLVDARFFGCISGEGSWVRDSLAHTWNLCPGLILEGEGVPMCGCGYLLSGSVRLPWGGCARRRLR